MNCARLPRQTTVAVERAGVSTSRGTRLAAAAGMLDLSGLTPCGHLLTIVARDADGNAREISRRRFFVTP